MNSRQTLQKQRLMIYVVKDRMYWALPIRGYHGYFATNSEAAEQAWWLQEGDTDNTRRHTSSRGCTSADSEDLLRAWRL